MRVSKGYRSMAETGIGKRIMIAGCPGSGKSTLAVRLQEITGLPLYHLDSIWWKADRTHISRSEYDGRLDEIIQKDSWIIDGDYSRTYEPRIAACDTIIFLDLTEEECLEGIRDRIGKERADMPWTDLSLDPALERQVLDYRSEERPRLLALIDRYPGKRLLVFHTREEIGEWLSGLEREKDV